MMAQESKNNIFIRAFYYIKNNLAIGYSIILLLLVPAAFFANNYLINTSYANTVDEITRKKAILVENVLNSIVYDKFSDPAALQSLVDQIVANYKDEIIALSILKPRENQNVYDIIASSDPAAVGQERQQDNQIFLALTNPNSCFLDEDNRGRFWKVMKSVHGGPNDERLGLMEMSLSLAEPDATMNEVITYSYWVLLIIILVLVLLLANQIRLLDYALSLNKLREVDKMKDMFISMASHELRSPLTAIRGYLDLLKNKEGLDLDKESSRYIENMSLSTERLDNLVADILEVSRIEGNRLPMEITVFDPNPVIAQSVEEMRSQAVQKGLALNYKPLETPVKIKADTDRLKQVVINLISNAVKYTQKGSIEVTTAIKKENFLIMVADTGIGISSEDQSQLFQKFSRIKNEYTKNVIGTGLGLWITAEIVKKMHGKISFESIEGVGSHFTAHFLLVKR